MMQGGVGRLGQGGCQGPLLDMGLHHLVQYFLVSLKICKFPPPSSMQHAACSMQHPASSIQHPASSIQHPASLPAAEGLWAMLVDQLLPHALWTVMCVFVYEYYVYIDILSFRRLFENGICCMPVVIHEKLCICAIEQYALDPC